MRNRVSVNIGFGGILFFVFLILKLCRIITWSWWWITAPLWGPPVFWVLVYVVVVFLMLAAKLMRKSGRPQREGV